MGAALQRLEARDGDHGAGHFIRAWRPLQFNLRDRASPRAKKKAACGRPFGISVRNSGIAYLSTVPGRGSSLVSERLVIHHSWMRQTAFSFSRMSLVGS